MTDPANDSELLARFVATGSQEAFAQVVARHINLVHAAALRQVRDPHLAEDVSQTVFTILACKARQFRPGTVVGAWLLNATWYVSRDLIKRETRRRKREHKRAQMTPTTHEPHDPDEWAPLAPLLDAALAGLSDADRQVIVLKYFEGRNDGEAAGILGVSENTLRQRRFRGLQRLRAYFHRRGVAVAGEFLAVQLTAHAVAPAPPGLALSVSQQAVAMAGNATAASAAAWLKGAMLMGWFKTNAVTITLVVLLLLTGTGLLAGNHFFRHKPRTVALKADDGIGPRPVAPARFKLGEIIPARAFTDKRGCQDFGNGVGWLDTGCWLHYANVDFGDGTPEAGAARFVVYIAVPASNEGGEVAVHLDKPDGPVISRLRVAATGGWGKSAIQSAPVESAAGLHDVYLSFSGSGVGNLFWAMFVGLTQPQPSDDVGGGWTHRAATQPDRPTTRPSLFLLWPIKATTQPATQPGTGQHP
jgi:RNA polymerase sigma factor (sigma-70 family)